MNSGWQLCRLLRLQNTDENSLRQLLPWKEYQKKYCWGQFLNGLKDEVKAEVRLLSPMSLKQAMEMALNVEEKNKVVNWRRFGVGKVKVEAYTYSAKGVPPSTTASTYST